MTFRILSLDGGGIRGVLSARILKQVEDSLQEKKGQKLHEYFDLVAGTSTGSILAAGIACQINADRLINFYEEEGPNIFLESVRRQRRSLWLGQVIGGYGLYPHEKGEVGLSQVLKKNLIHPEFGRCPAIGEVRSPHLLIFAYDVLSRCTTWFSNDYDSPYKQWYDNIELWKICTASASAPTFFPPYDLPYNDDQSLPHIDGGVSANAPELAAIAHALLLNKDKPDFNIGDIAVLSIGTGKTTRPFSYDQIRQWKLLSWIKNLPNIFMDPASEISVAITKQILESTQPHRYLRLNFDLNQRLQGQRIPGRLRKVLQEGEEYNKYTKTKLSEEIDDPESCPSLIAAAAAYLKEETVSYGSQRVSAKTAIEQFIEQH